MIDCEYSDRRSWLSVGLAILLLSGDVVKLPRSKMGANSSVVNIFNVVKDILCDVKTMSL